MEIKTKYKIWDKVYYIIGEKIECMSINEILISPPSGIFYVKWEDKRPSLNMPEDEVSDDIEEIKIKLAEKIRSEAEAKIANLNK